MRRMRKKGFTLVELLVVISIIGLLLAILFPALSAAMKTANQMKCGANLKSIGLAMKIYSSQNRGKWPTVYSYNSTGNPNGGTEAWGEAYTDESTLLADRGATAGTKLKDHVGFTCNISAWWTLVRSGMATSGIFICPRTSMDQDTTQEPTQWWSFEKIGNVSYSYQNQYRTTTPPAPGEYSGGNTNDNCDSQVIVAADRNPMRGDVTDIPTGNTDTDVANWNSPNHDFEGQQCLYADGHVEFNNQPTCGFGKNNIWQRSTYKVDTAGVGTWTEDTSSYSRTSGAAPSGNFSSGIGHKNDSFLVP